MGDALAHRKTVLYTITKVDEDAFHLKLWPSLIFKLGETKSAIVQALFVWL